MTTQISQIDEFYHQPDGRLVAQLLRPKLTPHMTQRTGLTRAGFGYPFAFLPATDQMPVLIPEECGALAYNSASGIITASCQSDRWPIASEMLDHLTICHGLEFVHNAKACLAEAHRTLCGSGQLLLMVPHRRSLWVRSDETPLGQGKPFSRRQITMLLHQSGFEITAVRRALFVPPVGLKLGPRIAHLMETYGHNWFGMFGGVMIITATKQIYAMHPPAPMTPIKALSGWLGGQMGDVHPNHSPHETPDKM